MAECKALLSVTLSNLIFDKHYVVKKKDRV